MSKKLEEFNEENIQDFLNKEIKEAFIDKADFLFGENNNGIEEKDLFFYELSIYALPLYLFSIIEALSGLYSNDRKIQVESTSVAKFLNKYFSAYCPIFKDVKFCNCFFKTFRNNLAHSWSPSTSITFDFVSKLLFTENQHGSIGFNFVGFYRVFKLAFEDYKKDLVGSKVVRDNFLNRHSFVSDQMYLSAKRFTGLFCEPASK